MPQLADVLRAMRADKGLTQQQAAGLIGIPHNTYVRYETGLRLPKTEIAAKIANFYGITVSDLVSGVIPKNKDKQVTAGGDEGTSRSCTGARSSIIGNANSTNNSNNTNFTTNNYYKDSPIPESIPSQEGGKHLFYALIDSIRKMDDHQLSEMLDYSKYILSKPSSRQGKKP